MGDLVELELVVLHRVLPRGGLRVRRGELQRLLIPVEHLAAGAPRSGKKWEKLKGHETTTCMLLGPTAPIDGQKCRLPNYP